MPYLIRMLVCALTLATLTAGLPAHAADIAVVNIQKIMREAKAANAIRNQVKQKQESFQRELSRKEKALQQEDQELAKQRNVLSQDAFQAKYAEFRKKAAEAQREVRVKRSKLDKGLARALGDIQDKVTDIVKAVSEERGFDIALSGNQVLYTSDKQDITAEVLKRLDQQMPNVNVNFN